MEVRISIPTIFYLKKRVYANNFFVESETYISNRLNNKLTYKKTSIDNKVTILLFNWYTLVIDLLGYNNTNKKTKLKYDWYTMFIVIDKEYQQYTFFFFLSSFLYKKVKYLFNEEIGVRFLLLIQQMKIEDYED